MRPAQTWFRKRRLDSLVGTSWPSNYTGSAYFNVFLYFVVVPCVLLAAAVFLVVSAGG